MAATDQPSANCGRLTGTTVSRPSSPRKSSGFVVNKESSSAPAILAIIRSAVRRRALVAQAGGHADVRP